MNIALVTPHDTSDRFAWSGVPFQVRKSLSLLADVQVVQTDSRPSLPDRLLRRAFRAAGRKYLIDNTLGASLIRGKAASRAIRKEGPDVVVAVAATCEVAGLVVNQPVIHVNDATFKVIKDYYPHATGLCLASSLQAEWVERRALRRADACVFPSAWALESVVVDYGIDPGKVHLVEFGACVVPQSPPVPSMPRPGRDRRILLVTRDWVRKGGSRAVRVLDELIARGCGASLSVVGNIPAEFAARADIRACGRLDANTDEGREALSLEYLSADVLLDTSPAICTGVGLMDAAAHGLPVVAADTGGVSSVVVSGETGILLPPEATPADYASAVERITAPDEWTKASRLARLRHETTLNWTRWAEKTMEIAEQLVIGERSRP